MELPEMQPLGKYHSVPGFDTLIQQIKLSWETFKSQFKKINRKQAVQFMMKALDSIIVFMFAFEMAGKDKKTFVIGAMTEIYDYVIISVLPFWLKPFGKLIRRFVINFIIAGMIDWMILKYSEGFWGTKEPSEVLKIWQPNLAESELVGDRNSSST